MDIVIPGQIFDISFPPHIRMDRLEYWVKLETDECLNEWSSNIKILNLHFRDTFLLEFCSSRIFWINKQHACGFVNSFGIISEFVQLVFVLIFLILLKENILTNKIFFKSSKAFNLQYFQHHTNFCINSNSNMTKPDCF